MVNLCCDCKQLFTSRKSRLWCDDCAKVREPWRLPEKDEATREWERQQARNRRIRLGQPAVRLCKRCGQPATSSRSWYCDRCRSVAVARHRRTYTKSATARGYGSSHRQLRKSWVPKVEAGEVACGHCGRPIAPDEPWDLSHPADRKDLPPEPWHRRCNRQYAAQWANRQRGATRRSNR
jgi:hypothetical protein